MSAPRATMRLQLHRGFPFAAAADLVPYLAALGVSHLYASPIMTARPGSLHGYDVIDPTHVNPELGGEQGLSHLVSVLRQHAMGLIIDFVPNHMAVGSDNPWWMDVLAHGRASRHARFFDIDWEPDDRDLTGKVLLPILGRPYGEALAAGEITLRRDPRAGAAVHYFDHVLPVASGDREVEHALPDDFDPVDADGRERLDRLLSRQHYRLAWWRSANDAINWRRFFDINGLAALRMEEDEAFEAVHATLFRLYADGLIDGVRIDHVDGLSEPGLYCRQVRARLDALARKRPEQLRDQPAYLVVEKILGRNEELPVDWQTDGTTGYDFMDAVSALLHDPGGEDPLTRLWTRVSGRSADFATEEEQSRRQVLQQSFAAQLAATVRAFHDLARGDLVTRDIARPAICRVLNEILAHFPVYRSYARVGACAPSDRAFLAQAVAAAQASSLRTDRAVLDRLSPWLAGERVAPKLDPLQAIALTRFQQLSAPLSAKAVEDTAFYRYGRLISRNDVGFDPRRFACSPTQFHHAAQARLERYPRSMLATATHDHKRGEDVRARLAVLSEVADDWTAAVERWIARSAHLQTIVDGAPAPEPGDLVFLFQTIVGAWPPTLTFDDAAGLAAFAERIAQWQQKALREAKLASDWAAPNEPYETAARRLVTRLFGERSELLRDVATFAHRIAPAGAANGLAQTLLKLTAPGVPDCYQGTEYWDLSLVDPDNRRPVDFDARRRTLGAHTPAELADDWTDGRIKQALIARVLAVRRAMPRLFAEGDYVPLAVEGARADHVVAFARVMRDRAAIALTARFTSRLLGSDGRGLSIPHAGRQQDTRVLLPSGMRAMTWSDALVSGAACRDRDHLPVARAFARLPVALLVSE